MAVFDNNLREILFSEVVSVTGGLLAGFALISYTNQLFLLPGLLIIIPGFLEMRGSISGSFSSRLSSGLFLGVISPDKFNTQLIRSNLAASFVLALVVSVALGVVACAFTYAFSGIFYPKLIAVAAVAGVASNAIEIPLALFFTMFLFRQGHDPNNIMGPFMTSVGDVVSIFSLMAAVALL